MAIRRRITLRDTRVNHQEFIPSLVEAITHKLQIHFPPAEYVYSVAWEEASYLTENQDAQPTIGSTPQLATVHVSQGSSWGVAITVLPETLRGDTWRIVMEDGMPLFDTLRIWIKRLAMVLGLLAGIGITAYGLHCQEVTSAKLSFIMFGCLGALVVGIVGFLLIFPLRLWALVKMSSFIHQSDLLLDELWSEQQRQCPQLPVLTTVSSPVLWYSLGSSCCLAIAISCYFLGRQVGLASTLVILVLFVVGAVAGLFGFGMFFYLAAHVMGVRLKRW